jgi:hypothetical protein
LFHPNNPVLLLEANGLKAFNTVVSLNSALITDK